MTADYPTLIVLIDSDDAQTMTTSDNTDDCINKGKRRALDPYASERTPLLSTPPQSPSQAESASSSLPQRHSIPNRSLCAKLTSIFLISLSICILFFSLFALLAWSYASRASSLSPEDIINKDLVVQGPDRIDVLNITLDGGIWLNVEGRMGLDAGTAIGVSTDDTDNIVSYIWKAVGRWSVRTLGQVSVNMSTVRITPEDDLSTILMTVQVSPVEIPLTVDPPKNSNIWLTNISMPVLIRPTTDIRALLDFLRHSWQDGAFRLRADVSNAIVRGGTLDRHTWKNRFYGRLSNIRTRLRIKVPQIPGVPYPGHNVPFPSLSELLTLQSFTVSSKADSLDLQAQATIINPLPASFNFTSPSLPFVISLPSLDNTSTETSRSTSSPIPIAIVDTLPLTATHPNITFNLRGSVLPLSSTYIPSLSNFLSLYLHSSPHNPIFITPSFMPFKNFILDMDFPAPSPRPRILRDVTIKDMRIRPTASGTFLASGIVQARVVLPKGMDIGVGVKRVLPDVLIFDGEVPDIQISLARFPTGPTTIEIIPPPPEAPPLPDPIPEGAFGRIRPEDWLVSTSTPAEEDGDEGKAYDVSAKVVDVPLEVLPGRQKLFSEFVGKVIFGSGNGALAGILGEAAVMVEVDGLPVSGRGSGIGEIELGGLPVRGSVRIGRKSMSTVADEEPWTGS